MKIILSQDYNIVIFRLPYIYIQGVPKMYTQYKEHLLKCVYIFWPSVCVCVCVCMYIYVYKKGNGKVHPITGHEGPEGE